MLLKPIKKTATANTLKCVLLVLLISFPVKFFGQTNFVDLTFNPTDVTSHFDAYFNGCSDVQYLADAEGRIIVTCHASEDARYNTRKVNSVFRLTPDGLPDTTFQSNPEINSAHDARIQSDGKIILKGTINNEYSVIRLNTDGSTDSTGTVSEIDPFDRIEVYPGNKLLVFHNQNTDSTSGTILTRLQADGTPDSTFNNSLTFNGTCSFVKVFDTEKVIIGGDFTSCGGQARRFLVLLNPDGTVNDAFNTETGFNEAPEKMTFLEDGSILAYGNFTSFNGTNLPYNDSHQYLVKLNNNGELDQNFNLQKTLNDKLNLLYSFKNNQFLTGSVKVSTHAFEGKIEKFNADGTQVNSFNCISIYWPVNASEDFPFPVTEQSESRFFLGSNAFNNNGKPDFSFNPTTGFIGVPSPIEIDADGNILIAYGNSYFSEPVNHLIRLLPDGQKDPSFNITEPLPPGIQSLCIQADGKTVVGSSTIVNDNPEAGLTRLNNDGSIDKTFNPDVKNYLEVNLIKEYDDDKLIVVFNRGRIKRIFKDGRIDNSFEFVAEVNDLSVLPDGKLLATGAFYSSSGFIGNSVRINSNGSLDHSYALTGSHFSQSMRILDNGSILGIEKDSLKVCLYSHAGHLIADFGKKIQVNSNQYGSVPFDNLHAVGIQDKILLAGNFKLPDIPGGEDFKERILFLDKNGTIDTSYTISYGGSWGYVSAIKKQTENRVILTGLFDYVENTVRNKIARLNVELSTGTENLSFARDVKVWPNPTTGLITVELTDDFQGSVSLYNNMGQKISEEYMDGKKSHVLNLSKHQPGIYFLHFRTKKESITHKIVLQ